MFPTHIAQSDIADCRADLLAILFASPRSVETSAGRCDAAHIIRCKRSALLCHLPLARTADKRDSSCWTAASIEESAPSNRSVGWKCPSVSKCSI
jgi:hypothetical protein